MCVLANPPPHLVPSTNCHLQNQELILANEHLAAKATDIYEQVETKIKPNKKNIGLTVYSPGCQKHNSYVKGCFLAICHDKFAGSCLFVLTACFCCLQMAKISY